MSALGQKRTFRTGLPNGRFAPKTAIPNQGLLAQETERWPVLHPGPPSRRHPAGARPNIFLNARENAASDSYPTASAI